MTKKRAKRFRLLIYERMWQRWAFPSLCVAPASVVLWLMAPRIYFIPETLELPLLGLPIPLRPLMLIPALVALFILAYSYLARRRAWVQCRANHLRIQTPILPLAISYARIKSVSPSRLSQVFDPAKEKPGRRDWLKPYWGMTAVVTEISKYPTDKRWLRLWFNRYLFPPTVVGFVFVVDDWMALSRQLSDYRADWEARRTVRRRQERESRPY